ncbi:MAG: hypothetical protein WCC17_08530 [Candidatus Nitrosopolaris sp.]
MILSEKIDQQYIDSGSAKISETILTPTSEFNRLKELIGYEVVSLAYCRDFLYSLSRCRVSVKVRLLDRKGIYLRKPE